VSECSTLMVREVVGVWRKDCLGGSPSFCIFEGKAVEAEMLPVLRTITAPNQKTGSMYLCTVAPHLTHTGLVTA